MQDLLDKYPILTKRVTFLHPFQSSAINAVKKGQSCLVIAPTGKGKSLIYQIAGQELLGITIVVSPLIALINEQAEYLGDELAIGLNSNLSFEEQRNVLRDLACGRYKPKFIFLSPERLQNYFFRSALKRSGLQVSMIVVDEAHCISQWGFDFRPEYSQISYFVSFLKDLGQTPTIMAMTATIGKQAQRDILEEFSIKETNTFNDRDFLRKELALNFIEVKQEKEKLSQILSIINVHKPKKALIYFYDKSHCRNICLKLIDEGYSSATFYSGMDGEEKTDNYQKFKNGEINILCATSAFGMGMNIPDIDMVIHHRLPDSIEEYYQQVGRAARDKSVCPKADCFALWSEVNIEYKYDEFIPAVKLTFDQIKNAFKAMELEGQAGKPQSMEYSNYIKQGLARVRYALEKRGVMQTIGEVNGTPLSITFKKENSYWDGIVSRMRVGNNFVRAAANSGLTLQELIDYIFEKELTGEIEKFPAMQKKIFFISEFNDVPTSVAFDIIDESMKLSEYKEMQVEKLAEMVKSDSPDGYIQKYFRSQS